MKTIIFCVEKYRDCPIYYRQLKHHFEYLTVINNEIYTAHIEITPRRIMKIVYAIGLVKSEYSPAEIKNILKILRAMATSTVENILKEKK
jgi:coproporphyrinogen III oxidase-like Fe-S oxidoreductase